MGLFDALFNSDERLADRREKVRQEYLKTGSDAAFYEMNRLDNKIIDRMNKKYMKEHPDSKPRHREHGWYLPNDDD